MAGLADVESVASTTRGNQDFVFGLFDPTASTKYLSDADIRKIGEEVVMGLQERPIQSPVDSRDLKNLAECGASYKHFPDGSQRQVIRRIRLDL